MIGQPQYATVNALLHHRFAERRPLVAVHRGTGLGMIVENTVPAVTAALRSGADMVEIDIVESTDGDYFVFHEGYEPLQFGFDRVLSTLSTTEIEALTYGLRVAGPRIRIERLETVLRTFPGVLFNVDRSWAYWERLLPWLDGLAIAEQLTLKSTADDESLAILRAHPVKYPLIVFAHHPTDIDKVAADPEINLVGAEVLAPSASHVFCDPDYVASLQEQGLLVYVNALDLGNGDTLMAGWDDTQSVLGDPDEGWGRLVTLGADVIQTDWPALLNAYLGRELPPAGRRQRASQQDLR